MIVLESALLSLPMALGTGLAFGAGPCNITCLPFVAPVFVAQETSPSRAWQMTGFFSAGRLTGYALCGAIAGLFGQILHSWLESPWVAWLLGCATLLVGLNLLWQRRRKAGCQTSACAGKRSEGLLPGGLFAMGVGMALNPCVPLTAILVAASASGSVVTGLTLGLSFGAGAVVVPTLLFAVGVAHFGRQLRQHLQHWRPRLEVMSACLLIGLGVLTATGGIRV